MAFPDASLAKAVKAWDDFVQQNGSVATVTLRDGTTFDVTMVERGRNPNEDVTDGISARRATLQCMYSRWAAAAPANRDPEKGDRVRINDRVRAISSVERKSMGSVDIGWLLRLVG